MAEINLYAVLARELVPLPLPQDVQELHDVFDGVPLGVYSALRSYHGDRFVRLEAHLARCVKCLARAGFDAGVNPERMSLAIAEATRAWTRGDVRIRFDFLKEPYQAAGLDTRVLLALAPHESVPEHLIEAGARLALAPSHLARQDPVIKYTDWVIQRRVCREQGSSADEHLLLDESRGILEGISSNFFAVRRGTVVTAADGVLEGITRQIVIELCSKRGLPVQFSRLPLEELAACEEAFITSSTREVVPVSEVAGVRIGSGKPGRIVRELCAAYSAYAEAAAVRAGTAL